MSHKLKFLGILISGLTTFSLVQASNELGSLHESIEIGKVMSIGLNPITTGKWYLSSYPSNLIDASVSSSTLTVKAKAQGVVKMSVCSDVSSNSCLEVNINILSGSKVLGVFTEKPHLPKSWVQDGNTIFYINESGIIPIATWNIFINNGGKKKLIKPANSGDLSLPLQSLMIEKDMRVKK